MTREQLAHNHRNLALKVPVLGSFESWSSEGQEFSLTFSDSDFFLYFGFAGFPLSSVFALQAGFSIYSWPEAEAGNPSEYVGLIKM